MYEIEAPLGRMTMGFAPLRAQEGNLIGSAGMKTYSFLRREGRSTRG